MQPHGHLTTAAAAIALTIMVVATNTHVWRRETEVDRTKSDDNDDTLSPERQQQRRQRRRQKQQQQQQQQQPEHVPYHHERLSLPEMVNRSEQFMKLCETRRSVRFFSKDGVPREVIRNALQTACTAPSGAHKQPWTFVAIQDFNTKRKIRDLVEREETINYRKRMRKSWVDDVRGMVDRLHDTDGAGVVVTKPYLTEAPWLIVVLKRPYGIDPNTRRRVDHYYVQESVGIACGMLLCSLHNANLVTLTSTPMGAEGAIRDLLDRPEHERVYLLMPVGFPSEDATVPYRDPVRRPLAESVFWKC